jgi:hypothetical protein
VHWQIRVKGCFVNAVSIEITDDNIASLSLDFKHAIRHIPCSIAIAIDDEITTSHDSNFV